MQSTNTLDTKIIDAKQWSSWTKAYRDTDLGIELELEGTLLPLDAIIASPKFWSTKNDSSLRNGFEYVLQFPIKISDLDLALNELGVGLKKMQPKSSIRTSTHIHVNVLDQTIQQVYNSIAFYYLLEELLIDTQPLERKGNLFALRMSDSASIPYYLEWSVRDRVFFNMFQEETHKYSAFNLCTINRFGSLEYRLFAAMTHIDDIRKWSKVCLAIVREGAKYDVATLLDMYDALPVKKFLRQMLPDHGWLYESKTSEYLNECLRTNYDRLRDLARSFNLQNKYRVPKSLWVEDQPEPDAHSLKYEADLMYNVSYADFDSVDEPAETQWAAPYPFPDDD